MFTVLFNNGRGAGGCSPGKLVTIRLLQPKAECAQGTVAASLTSATWGLSVNIPAFIMRPGGLWNTACGPAGCLLFPLLQINPCTPVAGARWLPITSLPSRQWGHTSKDRGRRWNTRSISSPWAGILAGNERTPNWLCSEQTFSSPLDPNFQTRLCYISLYFWRLTAKDSVVDTSSMKQLNFQQISGAEMPQDAPIQSTVSESLVTFILLK